MDGTVTPSRRTISPEIKHVLENLGDTIGIISGSHNEQMTLQMDNLPFIKMGQWSD